MKKLVLTLVLTCISTMIIAQKTNMTPERLIKLGRVSGKGISKDNNHVVFGVSKYSFTTQKKTNTQYSVDIDGGEVKKITIKESHLHDKSISPNKKYKIIVKNEKLQKVSGSDFHPDITNSNVMIYDALNYRHWDSWEDGTFNHIMYRSASDKKAKLIDIMKGEPFHSPQKPFGGSEDYLWSPDSKSILYVSKKESGTAYTISTNANIFQYELATEKTTNLTKYNKGYDTSPAFSSNGNLAWLQMKRDGYESDKNDIIVRLKGKDINLTEAWDGTVNSFLWAKNGKSIFFVAPVLGTVQVFEIKIASSSKKIINTPRQITNGQFDVYSIIGQVDHKLAVLRRDMNHAAEVYSLDIKSGETQQLSHVNDKVYAKTNLGKVEKRMTKTTDGKQLLSWVIYPPDFDPNKKYPTILYCQGGPQGALSQFYSFRWNFQLMAAHGYIIIAPNRRGMPGYGVEWNEQISKDYGGQNMDDYLSAIDDISNENYVDANRLGCIGASYGGYSAFYLAGKHEGRFKSFISHDGIFDWRSMYGTTEEIFFPAWDLGGAYWDKNNKDAQKAFNEFNPTTYIDNWDTPILIIQGGKDYRVPIGQGLAAFQAAQLKGIKSKLIYFPEENHWVLNNQNSLIWQREFYRWLKETM